MPDQVRHDGFEGGGKNRLKLIYRRNVGRIVMRRMHVKNGMTYFPLCAPYQIQACAPACDDLIRRIAMRPTLILLLILLRYRCKVLTSISSLTRQKRCAWRTLQSAAICRVRRAHRWVHVNQNITHQSFGGSHNSTRLPSGSITHPNLPYSESSTLASTSQPSSRKAASRACKSSTR